jgi:hypothetical protein
MPHFVPEKVSLYYEEHGRGFPLLLLAPGGMNSTVAMWEHAAVNPLAAYGDDFRLIAMDQRNAGGSSGPLDVADPWGSYVEDQLALLDHLGIDTFHVMGCCIGGSFILKLLEVAPERVMAAVLEQPIGVEDHNRHLFDAMWRSWGTGLAEQRPDIDPSTATAFGEQMWQGDFVVSVTREFVRACTTPMLVLPGIDDYHPTATGREIVALAPGAGAIEPWKESPEQIANAIDGVRQFLRRHTP